MKTDILRSALCAGLPPLFEVDPNPMPDGSRCIITPFMYDDGTMAQIFVADRQGRCILTDGGETMGWLWQRTGEKRTPEQLYLLNQICRRDLGMTDGYRGELMLQCDRPEDLAAAVFRLGQAMLRVSDLWFLEPASAARMGYNASADAPAAPARGMAV